MKYDYVVIGAGVSGMASAIILAKNGLDIALVEKSPKTAPLLKGFRRKGIHFDTGIHYTGGLGDGELLDTLFHYLGLQNGLQKEPLDPDGFDLVRCIEAGFEFLFPYGYHRLRERLYEAFPHEKRAVDTFLRDTKETYNLIPYISLDANHFLVNAGKTVHGPSLTQYLEQLTDNETLKWVLSIHCIMHGVSPEEVSFSYHATVIGSYFESVHRIRGGGSSLGKAFDAQLSKLGIDVYCGQGVTKIGFSIDQRPKAVHLEDGNILECTGCVSTVHPHEFLNMVPESLFRPAYRKRLQRLEETPSAYILFGSCKTGANVIEYKHLVATNGFDFTGFRQTDPLEKRPMFLACKRQEDIENGDIGLMAICPGTMQEVSRWLGTFTGRRSKDYAYFKEQIVAGIRRQIKRCCPEIEEEIEVIECATPLTIRDFTHSPFGSVYGVKHKIGQFNPLPKTKAEGLYLAGQATVAPGILGSIISAFLACGFILGHDNIFNQLRKYQ